MGKFITQGGGEDGGMEDGALSPPFFPPACPDSGRSRMTRSPAC